MTREKFIFVLNLNRLIGWVDRVFANGPGDLGLNPGQVIPKTLKRYLIPPCLTLSIIRYISRVKWSNPGKGVAPSPTPRCGSYWKGSLLVVPDYGRQLTFIFVLPDMIFRVFANGPEDLGSIPGQVIPRTKKMVLDASLLNAQHCKV